MLMVFWGFYDNSNAEGSGEWGTQTNRRSWLWVPSTANNGSNNDGYVQRGYMMLPSTTPGYNPGHRLLVYVKNGETVFYGFRRNGGTGNVTVSWFYDQTTTSFFPTGVSGTGRVSIQSVTYALDGIGGIGRPETGEMAAIGPFQLTGQGYVAHFFVNNTGADRAFWVELSVGGMNIDFWDITVASGNGTPSDPYQEQKGRVYSRFWSIVNGLPNTAGAFNTTSFHDNFGFYVPVDNTFSPQEDYFVKYINFGRSNAGYVNFFANQDGPRNNLSFAENRKSIQGTSSNFQYPLFINDPDPSIWASTDVPTATVGVEYRPAPSGEKGGEAVITVVIDLPGILDILIDLNENGIYDPLTDIIISQNFPNPGAYTITWDGRDASGKIVEGDQEVEVIVAVVFFPVHFPIFDMEQSLGMTVSNIRPGVSENNKLFWDDSLLPTTTITPANSIQSVIVNVTGRPGPDHIWWATGDNGFGNNMTINTWAASYYTEVKESFSTLPVSWLYFRGRGEENRVQLEWATAQERNNDYFVVERSPNGRSWEDIGEVEGVGDSEAINFYGFTDERPLLGNNFYRIRQVDRDRKTDHTQVVRIYFDPVWDFRSYPNPVRDELVLELKGLDQYRLALSDLQGRQFMAPVKNSLSGRLQLDMSQIPPGLYVVTLEVPNKVFTQRVHKVY